MGPRQLPGWRLDTCQRGELRSSGDWQRPAGGPWACPVDLDALLLQWPAAELQLIYAWVDPCRSWRRVRRCTGWVYWHAPVSLVDGAPLLSKEAFDDR